MGKCLRDFFNIWRLESCIIVGSPKLNPLKKKKKKFENVFQFVCYCLHCILVKTQKKIYIYIIKNPFFSWTFNMKFFFFSNPQAMSRPRIKRVNLKDLIFLMEQDRSLCRSAVLYKTFFKWNLPFFRVLIQEERNRISKIFNAPPILYTFFFFF